MEKNPMSVHQSAFGDTKNDSEEQSLEIKMIEFR